MSEPPRRDGTDDEPVALALVCAIAALAGAVDACGLSLLNGLYVSFMSGNTTSLGVALAGGDWAEARVAAEIVGLYVFGAMGGELVAIGSGRFHLPVVILVSATVLAVPPLLPNVAPLAMTFAMGVLTASVQRAGPVAVSVTYVTGTLVKLGQGLARTLCGQPGNWFWLKQAVPWLGLLVGAAAGAACLANFGPRTLDGLPVVALLLCGCAALATSRRRLARP